MPPEVDLTQQGDEEMPAEQIVEPGNLQTALTAMANEFGAGAAMRMRRMDQLAEDAASMWSVALTSPTVMAAHGMRVASEAGSGRTRVEANRPSETSAAAPIS